MTLPVLGSKDPAAKVSDRHTENVNKAVVRVKTRIIVLGSPLDYIRDVYIERIPVEQRSEDELQQLIALKEGKTTTNDFKKQLTEFMNAL